MPTAITIRDLVKTFKAPREPGGLVHAVNRVSLDIAPGELFFLLGPSGCGKTTLLRMIAGFIDPTDGKIAFDGRDVTHAAPNKRNTGMVFQSYALWPHMTVEQNVAFGLSVRKVPKAEKDKRVQEALDAVQLGTYGKRKPNELSGGQQQRVALARALVIRPDVLLLDEPLSNLDAKLRIELRSQIREICKASGITSVYVTHDQKEALSMADRIAIMRGGVVQQVGEPKQLYKNPATPFVAEFLGETNFIHATVADAPTQARGTGVSPVATPTTSPATYSLTSPAGPFAAAINPEVKAPPKPGQRAVCSIRPESLSLTSTGPNTLPGRLIATTYLGELAQHAVELKDGTKLKVAELNPGRIPEPNTQVAVNFNPEDVVVLPPDPTQQ